MRKQNIPRSSVSCIFREKQKSIQFPKLKTWEKWISIVWKKYGKTQTFQIYGFLKYFGWSRNPYNSQNMRKVDFHSTRKVWENTNIPELWVSEIFWVTQKYPYNSQNMGKVDFHSTGKVWENTNISNLWVS